MAESSGKPRIGSTVGKSNERAAPAKPAIVAWRTPPRNFLNDIVIDYGPRDLLNRLFLKADTEFRELGIELSFAPAAMLMEINRANSESWRPLVPIFDAKVGGFNDDNGFVMLGRNRDGEIVLAQAQRLYTLNQGTTLKDEVESLRLFYADVEQSKGATETCSITCPTAANMTGRITYNGAVWYRPDVRGLGLMKIIGRVAKAYGFTKWYTDYTVSLMIEDVFSAGTAAKGGYPHHEWEVWMRNTPLGTARAALIWIEASEMIDYIEPYLSKPHTQVDAVLKQRSA